MRRYEVGLVAAGIVAFAVALAACEGGGGGTASPTTATGIGPGASVPGTQPVDTRFTGEGSAEYCRLARSYQEASSRLAPGATADLRQLFQNAARDIVQAVGVAPAEIKPDVTLVADGFSALVGALGEVDYDFTRLPPDLIVRFQSQDFVTASTRVGAYSRNVCGIGS